MDIDTFTIRALPSSSLDAGRFLIAQQNSQPLVGQGPKYGLCNAIMASPPRNAFAAEWLKRYDSFASTGRDESWDYHSVRLPKQLAQCEGVSSQVEELPSSAFFPFYWGEPARLALFETRYESMASTKILENSFTIHLWASGGDDAYTTLFSKLPWNSQCRSPQPSLYEGLACRVLLNTTVSSTYLQWLGRRLATV